MKNKQAELIKQLTDKQLLYNLFLTQIILLTLAFFLGIILFNDRSTFFDLFIFNDLNILLFGIPAGIIVVLFDLFMMKVTPSSYQDDGGINERIFSSLSYSMIFVVALVVAISEELLFRGVLQTHLGLLWTSIIFAAVHYRYLFNWFLFLNVLVLSFFIGFLFEWTNNLLVTITAHFLIDFILGVLIRRKKAKRVEQERG
ncbi:CPBP family intramembrane glutamic endopeptidase [Peribacillus butanolivorans]|uniref:CPBP family intramembrane metalloprotease n=1 Tax=Peribacillus butanolivorans TaxID=421767 RepID=A0AAX0S1Z1_9BACI|nr:type II CAAX endopeptidase family protein [Peribacillus butanolivorans]PEJ31137.1 CPBP family intramembrane metalloprotease [Peribacillus butanolivorans]QNU04157.1 CPBP family intramembrane metalloprotease [Peribacillus butanolivorans]